MTVAIYECDVMDKNRSFNGFHMMFADPPDNIGLKYKGFKDRNKAYEFWLSDVIYKLIDAAPISWLSFSIKHMSIVQNTLDDHAGIASGSVEARYFMQGYTFGYYRGDDFSHDFRPFLRFTHKGAPTYPDQVRVESARQRLGDKRADPRGRIPGDLWHFPRVTGNSKQRRKWCPTQLHEGIYKRAIDWSTKPGDTIGDMFAGTGTMARVAGQTHNVVLFEIDPIVCGHLRDEFATGTLDVSQEFRAKAVSE